MLLMLNGMGFKLLTCGVLTYQLLTESEPGTHIAWSSPTSYFIAITGLDPLLLLINAFFFLMTTAGFEPLTCGVWLHLPTTVHPPATCFLPWAHPPLSSSPQLGCSSRPSLSHRCCRGRWGHRRALSGGRRRRDCTCPKAHSDRKYLWMGRAIFNCSDCTPQRGGVENAFLQTVLSISVSKCSQGIKWGMISQQFQIQILQKNFKTSKKISVEKSGRSFHFSAQKQDIMIYFQALHFKDEQIFTQRLIKGQQHTIIEEFVASCSKIYDNLLHETFLYFILWTGFHYLKDNA